MRAQLFHLAQIDEGGAMRAKEHFRRQPGFELVELVIDPVGFVLRVRAHQAIGGAEKADIRRDEQREAIPLAPDDVSQRLLERRGRSLRQGGKAALFGFELRRVAVQAMSAVNGLREAFRSRGRSSVTRLPPVATASQRISARPA